MESHGITGEVQVTKEVYEAMKARFIFEDRGKIEVKGKGLMSAYLLTSRSKVS